MGFSGIGQLLQAGLNDLGGTLIHKDISRAAGADRGPEVAGNGFADLVAATVAV
jgi:FO synthase